MPGIRVAMRTATSLPILFKGHTPLVVPGHHCHYPKLKSGFRFTQPILADIMFFEFVMEVLAGYP